MEQESRDMLRERNRTHRGVSDSAAIRSRVVPKLKADKEKRRKVRQLREVWGGVTAFSAVMARLDRGIQYAEAPRLSHSRRGVPDRPVKPGDDSCAYGGRSTPPRLKQH